MQINSTITHPYNNQNTINYKTKQQKNTHQKYHNNTLSTITKMSMQHELPTELLHEIFSNVERPSPKFLGNIKIKYTNLNSNLMFVTFT